MNKTKKIIVLDVETANSTQDGLTYDIGFIVADLHGNIYEKHSFITYDIYVREKDLMDTAYYAHKLPLYEHRLKIGETTMVSLLKVKKVIREYCKQYNIKEVYAYNANFDNTALNTTIRYVTKSFQRYFLPYGIKVCCIWNMACQVLCNSRNYARYCLENSFYSDKGNCRTSAEVVYGYLKGNNTYEEEHTGLSDVMIEYEILLNCKARHKKLDNSIKRCCWRIPQKKFKKIYYKG